MKNTKQINSNEQNENQKSTKKTSKNIQATQKQDTQAPQDYGYILSPEDKHEQMFVLSITQDTPRNLLIGHYCKLSDLKPVTVDLNQPDALSMLLTKCKQVLATFLLYNCFTVDNKLTAKELPEKLTQIKQQLRQSVTKYSSTWADLIEQEQNLAKYNNVQPENVLDANDATQTEQRTQKPIITFLYPMMLDIDQYVQHHGLFVPKQTYCAEIIGDPLGKQRPRRGRTIAQTVQVHGQEKTIYHATTYTPAKTHNYERRVRHIFRSMLKQDALALTDPVVIEIDAHYKLPTSATKQEKLNMLAGSLLPEKTPDIDNIAKAVMDGLNPETRKHLIKQQGFLQDDRQVVNLLGFKDYAIEPSVTIKVTTLQMLPINSLRYIYSVDFNKPLQPNDDYLKINQEKQSVAVEKQLKLKQKYAKEQQAKREARAERKSRKESKSQSKRKSNKNKKH